MIIKWLDIFCLSFLFSFLFPVIISSLDMEYSSMNSPEDFINEQYESEYTTQGMDISYSSDFSQNYQEHVPSAILKKHCSSKEDYSKLKEVLVAATRRRNLERNRIAGRLNKTFLFYFNNKNRYLHSS